MAKIGIIGVGVVGKAIKEGFKDAHQLFLHDPKLGTSLENVTDNTDFSYIAVPTPSDPNTGECDTSIIESILSEMPNNHNIVIKSTIIPGTTNYLQDKYPNLKIGCSPEFLRSASSEYDFKNQDILVVGTKHKQMAQDILCHHKESEVIKSTNFFHVTPTQAELVKYAKNSFYAMKVIFANQFHDLSKELGEEWSVVKKIITSPQEQIIGPSHLDSPKDDQRGYGGDCLPKDTIALSALLQNIGIKYDFIEAIITDNEKLKNR
jgi:UDPglucose 6-dehydrogenase